MVLTDDDLAVLLCVYRHRFIRADDLYRLFPHRSRDRLSRRLTWLYRNQFLDRPIAQVDSFRSSPSQALVYGLDNAGARIVAERYGVPTGSADWRSRNRAFTRENLEHTLAITRFMVGRRRDLECLFGLDLAAAVFAVQLQKPVLGEVLGVREAVSFRRDAMIFACEIRRALPLAAIFAPIHMELPAHQSVLGGYLGHYPHPFGVRCVQMCKGCVSYCRRVPIRLTL